MTRPKDDTGRVPPRRCDGCGAVLRGKGNKKYCNGKCRAAAHRMRRDLKFRMVLEAIRKNVAELEDLIDHDR